MDLVAPQKIVLLVDDDTEFTASLSPKFESAGFAVHVAITGKEALDYIKDNPVDFIILDFVMPEMDGLKFYHTLKHDMRKNIPTIILTNFSGNQETEDLEVYVKSETDLDQLVAKIKNRFSPRQPLHKFV
ncbi:MAG: two-component system response regulator [Candidatus Levyibacteriota bacterium]